MADLNSTIVRGNLRVTDDINTSGYIYENGTKLINSALLSTKGDIIYASVANTPARLAIGSDGQFLSIASGIPTWVNNPDTKNTAGSTNSTNKLFLIGANTQAANPQTYSNINAYTKNGKLYSNSSEVVNLGDTQTITGAKVFTGAVGNTQTSAGVYLGLDANGSPNATLSIVSANTAAYIDMGTPNNDYGFRIIKWNGVSDSVAQFTYNDGTNTTVTVPRRNGILGLQIDIVDLTSLS